MTSTAPAQGAPPAASGRPATRPTVVLLIVLTAVFVQLLDVSIVNVAIPSIQRDLRASFSAVQLVLAGYQLAFACMLITGARLGDLYGRKKVFMTGMAVFTTASVLCGVAPSADVLIGSRILQGLGSGLMFPQVLAVIQVTIPGKERGRAFAMFGATIGLATILGPVTGGALIRLDLFGADWRMIFLVNLPVGVLALVSAALFLPDSRSPDRTRLDLAGVALVTTGLFLLIFPLTEGRTQGWPWWIYLMLLGSVPLLAGFVLLQRRKTREDTGPLLRMTLFGNRAFTTGLTLSMVFFAGIPAFFFTFSLYLQLGLGFTPLHSGATTLAFACGSAVASARSEFLTKRLGRDVLSVGCALLAVGVLVLIAAVHAVGDDLHSWELAPVLLVCGLGLGFFVAPNTNIILAGIKGREAGSASGVLSTAQQVGGALGVAVVGVIFFTLVGGQARSSAQAQVPRLTSALTRSADLPAPAAAAATGTFVRCFDRQANSPDPSQTPSGCPRPSTTGPAAAAFGSAVSDAQARSFRYALERTLLVEVGIFVVAFLLVRRLPPVDPAQLAGAGPPAGE